MGNVGLYLALRHITQKCAAKVQRYFKSKPSDEGIAILREGYIYRDKFAASITRLEIEIGNLRTNPKDAMLRIEKLVAKIKNYSFCKREKIFSVTKMNY